jgi:hypothetical protein
MAQTEKPSKPKPAAKKPVKTARKPAAQKTARKASKPDEPQKDIHFCSFCQKSTNETRRLIAGPNGIFIYEECVEICISVLYQDSPNYWEKRFQQIMANPQDLRIKPPENKQKQPKTKKGKES